MTGGDDRLARAGDYVLGLMDDEARTAAEADIQNDPAFRDAVERFAASMHRLDETVSPAKVPPAMWEAIARQIAQAPVETDSSVRPGSNVVSIGSRPARKFFGGTMERLLMAACVLAALGIGYLAGRQFGQPQPVVMVVLQTPAQTPGAVFEAYADNSVRIVPLEDFSVPEGKIMQVWTLYDKAIGPVSLGTLPRAEVVTISGQPLPAPVAEQLYEITLENAPGSPTGKPTGPILVKGFAKLPAGD